MRKEYISFDNDLPVKVSFETIKEYPIHWHNSIEIMFVLKGTINVDIESGHYEVEDKELEIINCYEAHRIYSDDEENRVLIFHIDPNFFEKYYKDMENIFFYTNSSEEGAQQEEKYQILRNYLAIIACEAIQKSENYDEEIEKVLVDTLFHLINNFHYLIYDEEDLKENEIQFERYHRITKYIYNNYMNKISLQDIADQEYLSSYYLSHEIKNMSGTGFKDFLNETRVDESIKLLLDTDKTISEISEEVGFSHSRYYNKHFKMHYNCTPLQFRKKYYLTEENYNKAKKYEVYNLIEATPYLSSYLEDYERFNYENRIYKIEVDASKDGEKFYPYWKEVINLGDAKELLKEREQNYIRGIQNNIGFQYGILQRLFNRDMKIYFNENVDFLNWNEVEKLIEFLIDIEMKPIIIVSKIFEEVDFCIRLLESFILYFSDIYGMEVVQEWKFQISKTLPSEFIEAVRSMCEKYDLEDIIEEKFTYDHSINPIYDSSYMLPYVIHNFINNDRSMYFLKAFDTIEDEVVLNNELFFGYPGLITLNGIRKSSYYAYYLLSRMGDELIEKGDGYMVTKSEEDIQILLYSFNDELNNLIDIDEIYKGRGSKHITERKISLSIKNLQYDYKVNKYEISEKIGSAYNNWRNMGRPKRLTDEELEVLYSISFPNISLSYAKKIPVFNIITKLEGYAATLITLQKVQKHLF